MTSDSQAIVIQCVGCGSKLRLGASARGKTIACPKCGKQLTVSESGVGTSTPVSTKSAATSSSSRARSGAWPEDGEPVLAKIVIAKPVAAPAAPKDNWDDLQSLQPAASFAPQQSWPGYQAAAPKAKSHNLMWVWIGVGTAALLLLLGVGVGFAWLFVMSKSSGTPVVMSSKNGSPVYSPASSSGMPSGGGASNQDRQVRFPELGAPLPFSDKVVMHRVPIWSGGRPMWINVFVPKGEHINQSLPVMFEAPAGTNLLHGADVEFASAATEYLPFTEAGMITVSFSIHGRMPPGVTPEAGERYMRNLAIAYKHFTKSDAGVACGSSAIDFVLQKVPAADPKRLYVWGHSSAATLALLLASKDNRISKCIAVAPITDLKERLGEMLTERSIQQLFPQLPEYFESGSPITHVRQLKCPVFVAHARDDDNEPFENTQKYVRALEQAGGKVTFEARTSGGHYQELIEASIPKAIEWLQR